jgi:uracil-DNA glycosylase
LPPRPECADLWHERLLALLPRIELTLLLSRYAIDRYIGPDRRATVTEVVRDWKRYRPARLPMPHPSPRNNRWLAQNPWFEAEVVPYLRRRVKRILAR